MYLLLPVCCYFRYFTSKEQQQQVSSLNIIMVPTKRPNLFDVILIIKRVCVCFIFIIIYQVCAQSHIPMRSTVEIDVVRMPLKNPKVMMVAGGTEFL